MLFAAENKLRKAKVSPELIVKYKPGIACMFVTEPLSSAHWQKEDSEPQSLYSLLTKSL